MIRVLAVVFGCICVGSMAAGAVVYGRSWIKTGRRYDGWQFFTALVAVEALGGIVWRLATETPPSPVFWLVTFVLLNAGVVGITVEKDR